MGSMRPAGNPPAPFVVGVPRSGTTLLRLQLDAHPRLAIPPETGFGFIGDLATAGPEELLDSMQELPTWRDLGIEREELSPAFERLSRWSPGEGLRAFYRLYAKRHAKPRWGDKTPRHLVCMDALHATLPEAHFIHLIRDGRDVAASLRGLPFAPGNGSIEAIATAWRDEVAAGRHSGRALPHYRELRYERLVTDPEASLRELCEYVELDFDDSMLRAHERADQRLSELAGAHRDSEGRLLLADGLTIATRTAQPPDTRSIGRWRESLTIAEVGRFEALAGQALTSLGYEPATRR